MKKSRDKSNDRLRRWLADALGQRTLLATGPAPVFSAADDDPSLTERLERLDRSVSLDDLSFAPALRFAAAAEPAALRQLRRHEGLAPGAPAVLCPDTPAKLARLIDIARNCDLAIAAAAGTGQPGAVPVSFHRMRDVRVLDAAAGLVRFGRGAGWEDLEAADREVRLSVPPGIESLFPTPADAAEAGLFAGRCVESVGGFSCTFDMVLPPAGTVWLDGTWLFRDPAQAIEAFRVVCRRVPPFFARLYPASDLRLGERTGLWRLPDRPWSRNDFTGVRLVYHGNGFSARAQRFASTFPVEGRGGKFWRNGPLITAGERLSIALENGLSEITLPSAAALGEDHDTALAGQLIEATGTTAGTPLVSQRLSCIAGRFSRELSVMVPRDFTYPLGQWQRIAAAGAAPSARAVRPDDAEEQDPADTVPEQPAPPAGGPIADSDEWQAIRAALMPAGVERRDIKSA